MAVRSSIEWKDTTVNELLALEPRDVRSALTEPVVEFAEPWQDRRDNNRCLASIPHVTIVWPPWC